MRTTIDADERWGLGHGDQPDLDLLDDQSLCPAYEEERQGGRIIVTTSVAGIRDEIQGLALYLASPAATYVTGAQMVIDGGVLLGYAD